MKKNIYRLIAFSFTLLVIVFLLSTPIQAQIQNPAVNTNYGSYAGQGDFSGRFTRIFITFWNTAISLGTLTALAMLLWGSLEWITAGGESSKIQKARDKMTQSIIGLVILVFLFAIITIINEILFNTGSGSRVFDLLNFEIPTPQSPTP